MIRAAILIALLFLLNQSAAEEPVAVSAIQNRDDLLAQMGDIIVRSVRRQDTSHSVFHGCLDWHSAVHGHWAMCRIAQTAGDLDKKFAATLQSLSQEGIDREREYLRQYPRFEMPYGRAWFLLLAAEYELWAEAAQTPAPRRLRAMADEVAESLLAHYETIAPSINTSGYNSASWAMVRLHAYSAHVDNARFLERTTVLIRNNMLKGESLPAFRDDAVRSEFFSRFGNWAYLIVKTQDAEAIATIFKKDPLEGDAIRPVTLRPAAHHLGMNWSRAWALRALSRRTSDVATRTRLDQAFLAHVAAGMRDHATNAGNYGTYDHWVPQFAVYALTD